MPLNINHAPSVSSAAPTGSLDIFLRVSESSLSKRRRPPQTYTIHSTVAFFILDIHPEHTAVSLSLTPNLEDGSIHSLSSAGGWWLSGKERLQLLPAT